MLASMRRIWSVCLVILGAALIADSIFRLVDNGASIGLVLWGLLGIPLIVWGLSDFRTGRAS